MSSSEIYIKWEYRGDASIVDGYIITLTHPGFGNITKIVSHTATFYQFHGLRPYTGYEVRLAAMNMIIGEGTFTNPMTVITEECKL